VARLVDDDTYGVECAKENAKSLFQGGILRRVVELVEEDEVDVQKLAVVVLENLINLETCFVVDTGGLEVLRKLLEKEVNEKLRQQITNVVSKYYEKNPFLKGEY